MAAHRQNPIDVLREYSINEIERVAAEFHKNLGNLFSIPVDIEHILELQDRVVLDIYPGLAANHKLMGMAGIDENGKIFVYIDAELADISSMKNRYRMTIAEELAHVILHREAIQVVTKPNDFLNIQQHHKWEKYERNAKRLAAALLMPVKELLNHSRQSYTNIISKLPEEYKFTNPDAIKHQIARLLAEKYEVSYQSMNIRLTEWPIAVFQKINEAMENRLDFLS